MRIQSFVVSSFASNCYVLALDKEEGQQAVIIDPGDMELEPVFHYIDENQLEVIAVWNTHAHLDHVTGVDLVRNRFKVPAYIHEDDRILWENISEMTQSWIGKTVAPLRDPDGLWKDGDEVSLGKHRFRIWHTPGHSPGSVCLVGEELAFTGDTLFAGTIGRTDLPMSNPSHMRDSLKKLSALSDSLTLYPGHMQASTMERERRTNPFLQNL